MKTIIEKLGMNTPDELNIVGDVWKVYELAGLPRPHVANDKFFEQGMQLKKILDSRNEMLEALIAEWYFLETFLSNQASAINGFWYGNMCVRQKDIQLVIEKATGKKWAQIKEILEADNG
jgi:hypothetical protein